MCLAMTACGDAKRYKKGDTPSLEYRLSIIHDLVDGYFLGHYRIVGH